MGERRGVKALEVWCRKLTEGYPGVKVENMTTSWRDGLAFCAIIHHFRPDLIDFSKLNKDDIYFNNSLAFKVAERHLGIPALLDPEDMVEFPVPDRLSILTYLSQFYQVFVGTQGSPTRIVPKRPSVSSDDLSSPSTSPPTKMASRPSIGIGRKEPCAKCLLPVFLAERLNVGTKLYHRTCFRCARCNNQLSLANCYETENGVYCCETCPDEEKEQVDNPESTHMLLRSVSDEQKSASLKRMDATDISSALNNIETEESPITKSRKEFWSTHLLTEEEIDNLNIVVDESPETQKKFQTLQNDPDSETPSPKGEPSHKKARSSPQKDPESPKKDLFQNTTQSNSSSSSRKDLDSSRSKISSIKDFGSSQKTPQSSRESTPDPNLFRKSSPVSPEKGLDPSIGKRDFGSSQKTSQSSKESTPDQKLFRKTSPVSPGKDLDPSIGKKVFSSQRTPQSSKESTPDRNLFRKTSPVSPEKHLDPSIGKKDLGTSQKTPQSSKESTPDRNLFRKSSPVSPEKGLDLKGLSQKTPQSSKESTPDRSYFRKTPETSPEPETKTLKNLKGRFEVQISSGTFGTGSREPSTFKFDGSEGSVSGKTSPGSSKQVEESPFEGVVLRRGFGSPRNHRSPTSGSNSGFIGKDLVGPNKEKLPPDLESLSTSVKSVNSFVNSDDMDQLEAALSVTKDNTSLVKSRKLIFENVPSRNSDSASKTNVPFKKDELPNPEKILKYFGPQSTSQENLGSTSKENRGSKNLDEKTLKNIEAVSKYFGTTKTPNYNISPAEVKKEFFRIRSKSKSYTDISENEFFITAPSFESKGLDSDSSFLTPPNFDNRPKSTPNLQHPSILPKIEVEDLEVKNHLEVAKQKIAEISKSREDLRKEILELENEALENLQKSLNKGFDSTLDSSEVEVTSTTSPDKNISRKGLGPSNLEDSAEKLTSGSPGKNVLRKGLGSSNLDDSAEKLTSGSPERNIFRKGLRSTNLDDSAEKLASNSPERNIYRKGLRSTNLDDSAEKLASNSAERNIYRKGLRSANLDDSAEKLATTSSERNISRKVFSSSKLDDSAEKSPSTSPEKNICRSGLGSSNLDDSAEKFSKMASAIFSPGTADPDGSKGSNELPREEPLKTPRSDQKTGSSETLSTQNLVQKDIPMVAEPTSKPLAGFGPPKIKPRVPAITKMIPEPSTTDYPEELNPFGSDDENDEPQTSLRVIKPSKEDSILSPFSKDSSSESEMKLDRNQKINESELSTISSRSEDSFKISRPSKDAQNEEKKILKAPRISLNPFWSDDEEPLEDEGQKPTPLPRRAMGTPEPKPRRTGVNSEKYDSTSSLSSLNSSIGSSQYTTPSRKKKPAPKPPVLTERSQTLGVSSPNSLPVTPKSHRKNRKAPLPPSSTPMIGNVKPNYDSPISPLNSEDIKIISNAAISLNSSVDDSKNTNNNDSILSSDVEKEKSDKDSKNRNRQSQNLSIKNSETNSESENSPTKSYVPDKSTYGKWKRKKGPAPSRPVPQRRKIQPLPLAQIKEELQMIELQQQGMERQGVKLEQMIREKCEALPDDAPMPPDVEEYVIQLFELVNEKNELFRRQAELMYLRRQQRLEEEHADLEYQIRCLMDQPECNKTDSDKAREEELINRLVEVVERRNEIVECLEMDRVREAEEDLSITSRLTWIQTKREEETLKSLTDSNNVKLSKKEKKKIKKEKKLKEKGKNVDVDKDIDETEIKNVNTVPKEKKKKKWF